MSSERERLVEKMLDAYSGGLEWRGPAADLARRDMSAALAVAELAIRADEREASAMAAHEAWLDGVPPAEVAAAVRTREESKC